MRFLLFLLEKYTVSSDNLYDFAIQLFRQNGSGIPDIFIGVLVDFDLHQFPCQKNVLHTLHHGRSHAFLPNLHIGGKIDRLAFQILFLLAC